ncbi:MAG: hypothetical protein HS115_16730 [Spirochaetales bacterium]|nr:hypothetical protein [Spirochaetales bacterium]
MLKQIHQMIKNIHGLVLVLLLLGGFSAAHAQENTGFKLGGLPLVSYNSDDGFGYGLRAYGTYKEEGYDPYKYQVYVQYYKTTLGFEYHEINLDYLKFLGSPLRWKFSAGFSRTLNAQWYGQGNFHDIRREQGIREGRIPINENIPASPDLVQTRFNGQDITFNRKALDAINDPGKHECSFEAKNCTIINNQSREVLRQKQNKYYNYDLIKPFFNASTEDWFGDSNFKWFFGLRGQRYKVQSYQNDIDSGDRLPNDRTLIDIEKPYGYDATEGRRYVNGVRVALSYDSRPRDREKNPNTGIFADLHYWGTGSSTGSHYTFHRVTATYRQYIELFPSMFNDAGQELVFAYRVQGQETFGKAPFYELGTITTMNESSDGLGGKRGLRGYAANQFVDNVMAQLNTEVRWTFGRAKALGGLDFILLGYYDVGRVGETWKEIENRGLHYAAGGGIRLVQQGSIVVNISAGRSKYDSHVNFDFNHMF